MNRNAETVKTILVVDDDLEWLDFLSHAIGAEYPVLSASNSEDAIRRAQRAGPDAIVLDIMMPGDRDGFSTYSELQRDPNTRDIPVLILTEVNRTTGLSFGGDEINRYLGKAPAAFLEKPISAERLLHEVEKVLAVGNEWRGAECCSGGLVNRMHARFNSIPMPSRSTASSIVQGGAEPVIEGRNRD